MGNCQKGKPKTRGPEGALTISKKDREGRGTEQKGQQLFQCKIVLIGSMNVGKTCIVQRYMEGKVSDGNKNTIGASFFKKVLHLRDGNKLQLNIWDTGGQEKYKSLTSMYYKGAHAALITYSVIDEQSFKQLGYWIKQISENANREKVLKFIVGNKNDVPNEQRKVATQKGEKYVQEIQEQLGEKIQFFETSSLVNNQSISDIFLQLGHEIYTQFPHDELS